MSVRNPALWDESAVFVVDLAIAPIKLGGHGIEKAAAAERCIKAQPFCLLYDDRYPCICIGIEYNVEVVDLDELQEIGEDYLLRP